MLQDGEIPYAPNVLRCVTGLGAMTRLTELHIRVPFINKQEDLQGLTLLQRLALDYEPKRGSNPPGTTYHPFVNPEAATITKLRFYIGKDEHPVSITSTDIYVVSQRSTVINKILLF